MSFRLTSEEIDPPVLEVLGAGGFVEFTGRVRDHNEGHVVLALEYEAFGDLAVKVGNELVEESKSKFGLLEAHVLHRIGLLHLGETAVWIGVAAAHRKAAFAGCEYIIDELKKRVPIWKKEHYTDGESKWIGCDGQEMSHESS